MALSWSSFWIPRTSAPARVTLIVTTLLSSMLIYQGAILSIVDYLTAMQVYMIVNICAIILTMIEFIFVLQAAKGLDEGKKTINQNQVQLCDN